MKRVRGRDALYLHMERATEPMHTLKALVLDGQLAREELIAAVTPAVARFPELRALIRPVPLNLFHPVWIEGGMPDVSAHVHERILVAPGRVGVELADALAGLATGPLDRRRPLWELWLLDGLEEGRSAVVLKIHHALADGLASAHLLGELFTGGEAPQVPRAEPPPAASQLVIGAARDLTSLLRRLPVIVGRALAGGRAARAVSRGGAGPAKPYAATPLPWNRALTAERAFAIATVGRGDLDFVRRTFSVTFTEVLLAVVASAVRSHLAAQSLPHPRTLTATVPTSLRAGSTVVPFGNDLGAIFPELPLDDDEPAGRLAAISERFIAARRHAQALGPDVWYDLWELYPLFHLAHLGTRALMRRASGRWTYNLHVASVPGPAETLEIAGLPVTQIYSTGPLTEDFGINFTVWTYLDTVTVGILTCPGFVPDLGGLAARLPAALTELVASAGNGTSAGLPV